MARVSIPIPATPRSPRLWVVAATVLAAAIVVLSFIYFVARPAAEPIGQPAPAVNLPQVAAQIPVVVPPVPVAPSVTVVVPTPAPKKLLGPTTHGLILWETKEAHAVFYGLGSMMTLNPPVYEFPLYVSKINGSSLTTLAIIPDPNIEGTGEKWESGLIKDPDYEGFVLTVGLTRVAADYKYAIEFSFSPDGKRWLTARYPLPSQL